MQEHTLAGQQLFTVGQVARELRRHPDTIRDYARRGLIPAPLRDPCTGWRLWTADQVAEAARSLAPRPEREL
jgi:DNA-binding transcriptional MerR regulator